MATEVSVKDGIEIRSLRSGHCIREDEWTQFVGKVRALAAAWCLFDITPGLALILHARK